MHQRLKRGKYVHSAFDPKRQKWVYKNLTTMAVLEADPADNQHIYDLLNDPNAPINDDFDKAIKEVLYAKRFILEDSIDELAVLETRYWASKRNPLLKSIAVVTTLQCNLRCEYCYQDHVDETFSPEDEAALIKFLARSVRAASEDERGHFQLSWWGGEPLLGIKTIERLSPAIIDLFDGSNVDYSCYTSTNGVLLTPENCKILAAARLARVQVTIDGPEAFHNLQRPNVGGGATYRKILFGLSNICEELQVLGRFVTLRVNVTPRMIASVDDVAWKSFFDDLLEFREHLALNINPAVPNDFYAAQGSIENESFKHVMTRLNARAAESGLAVLQDIQSPRPGGLFCGAIPDTNWIVLPGRRLAKCTDNFHDKSHDCGRLELDGKMTLFDRAKEWIEYSPFESELCRTCDVLPICMGGCRAIPFESKNGDRCLRKATIETRLLREAAQLSKGG